MSNQSEKASSGYQDIDLLSPAHVTRSWVPNFLRSRHSWKVLSGKWKLESPQRFICIQGPKMSAAEDLCIVGQTDWDNLTFHVNFRMLSRSRKPPEGGTIVYFLFKNTRNHYSFHFCLFKQRIEFIKRVRGHWTIMTGRYYNLKTQRDYTVTINTNAGAHHCCIDGTDLMDVHDSDILAGCVGIGSKYCDVEFSRISASIPSRS